MERYVLIDEERLPDDRPEQRNAILAKLSQTERFPTIAIVWSDDRGIAHAVDTIVLKSSVFQ